MSELKTLKDIDLKTGRENIWDREVDLKNKLRDEAVKWVKEFERQNKEEYVGLRNSQDIAFIIHFFNLDEEDLKDESRKIKEELKLKGGKENE